MNSLKTAALILSVLATPCIMLAQADCTGGKYSTVDYFDAVKVRGNVTYGNNTGVLFPQPQSLEMDIYEPEADTLPGRTNRPLIIFAHGGSFIGGNKSEADDLCNSFAKMGYVAATIEYRTGYFLPDERTTTLAVVRGMHDMKAAIRFFRKDAANGNTYGVDTNRIVIGGISAGAIAAIQAAYLDQESEVPDYLANDTAALGGIDGNSGNPGYSSAVIGVVNFAGAIGDTSWMDSGDAPIVSFHYDGDNTVPYDTREVSVQGIATGLIASGSGTMHIRLENIDVPNQLITYSGSGHVDYLSGAMYDSVIDSAMLFLYENAVCKNATSIIGPPAANHNVSMELMPNPSNGNVVLRFAEMPPVNAGIEVYNALGKAVARTENIAAQETKLDLRALDKGVYFITLKTASGQVAAVKQIVLE